MTRTGASSNNAGMASALVSHRLDETSREPPHRAAAPSSVPPTSDAGLRGTVRWRAGTRTARRSRAVGCN
eukprot:4678673-Prymnesium_polylepis.1